MRKFRITVDGRSYNVVVEDLGEGAEVADPAPAAPTRAAPALTPAAPAPAARLPQPAPARSSRRWAAWWTRST